MGEVVAEKEHKDGSRRSSTGKAIPRGSASPARSDEKPIPHYLMPSTNSCHDFCKYGHKHAFEGDEKHPIRPNVLGNSRSPIHDQKPVKIPTVRERIKERGNKLKAQSKLNSEFPDKPKVREKQVLSPSWDIGSSEEASEWESIKKTQAIGLPSIYRRTYVKSKVVEQKDVTTGKANYDSEDSREIDVIKKKTTPVKKLNATTRPVLVKQKSRSFVRIPSLSSRTRGFRPKAPLSSEDIDESSEAEISLKPKTSTVKSAFPGNSSEEVTYQKSVEEPKMTQTKELKPLTASVSKPRQYIKRIASVKKRTVGKAALDTKNIKEKPSAPIQESTSQDGEDKAKLRRTKTVRLEDDSASSYKLEFKSGKVIDLPPESSAPVKLRFSRGRVVENSNNSVGAMWRRSFSRKSSRRRGLAGVVYNDPNSGAQVVVLRHQDVQKKDDQGLFNNVIEETATKLVKSRKSKVKALVGAFETVISSIRGPK